MVGDPSGPAAMGSRGPDDLGIQQHAGGTDAGGARDGRHRDRHPDDRESGPAIRRAPRDHEISIELGRAWSSLNGIDERT